MEKIGEYDLDTMLLIAEDLLRIGKDIFQFNTREYKIKWNEYNVHPAIKKMGITHFAKSYGSIVGKIVGKDKKLTTLVEIYTTMVRFYNITNKDTISDNSIKVIPNKNEIESTYRYGYIHKPDYSTTFKKENGYWTQHYTKSTKLSNWLSANDSRFCDFIDQEELQLMYKIECELHGYS